MKAFLPKKIIFWLGLLCLFILLLVVYAVFTRQVSHQVLQPVKPVEIFQQTSSCSPGQIDLLNYYLPQQSGKTVEIHHYDESGNDKGIVEFFHTYPAGVSNGKNGFYFVKSKEPQYFEEFAYDNEYIYHLKDTTWTEKCPNGDAAFYTLFDGSLGEGACSSFEPNQEGAKWVKRCLSLGETSGPFSSTILGFSKSSCECCLSSPGSEVKTLIYQGAYTFPNGWHSDDLIILQWPGGGEKYFVDRRYGTIGFEGAGFRSYPVNVETSSRQAQIECVLSTVKEKSIDINRHTGGRAVWRVESEDKESSSSGSAGNSTSEGPAEGTTFINSTVTGTKQKFPDFASMLQNFRNAFWALLPDKTAQKASLPNDQVEMKSVTFAFPLKYSDNGVGQPDNQAEITCFDGPPQPADDVAKETLALTQWGPLVGALTGVAGIIRPETVISDLDLYQNFKYFLSPEDWRCSHSSFGPGPVLATSDFEEAEDNKETFHVKNLLTFIKEFFDTVLSLFVKEKKKGVELRLLTELPGGNTAIVKSRQLSLSKTSEKRGHEFQLEGEAKQIAGELTAVSGLSPEQDIPPQRFIFAGQADTWWATCSSLCSSFSEKRTGDNSLGWVGSDKFCPSCDPEDYKTEPLLPVPPPPNLPPYCHWNQAYGCDYWTCQYNRSDPSKKDISSGGVCGGCGEGEVAFCEDTSAEYVKCRHPQMLNIAKDIRQPQGPCAPGTPGYDKVCTDFGQCVNLNFTSSVDYYQSHADLAEQRGLTAYIESLAASNASGPPYGPCFYANPDVCVKEGSWDNWDNCAIDCAPLCCTGNGRNYN